jgi:hypothetical protein
VNSQTEIDQATKKNLGKIKQPHPDTGVPEHDKNKQQTKTTKHTIEFSNNNTRHPVSGRATNPRQKPRARCTDSGTIRSPEPFPRDAVVLCGRTASQRLA